MKREFYVTSTSMNASKDIYPSTYRVVIEPFGPVVTKTGTPGGKGIRCTIYTDVDKMIVQGEAICIPSDKYDYDLGAKLALKRAMQHVFLPDQRKLFWVAFFYPFAPGGNPFTTR